PIEEGSADGRGRRPRGHAPPRGAPRQVRAPPARRVRVGGEQRRRQFHGKRGHGRRRPRGGDVVVRARDAPEPARRRVPRVRGRRRGRPGAPRRGRRRAEGAAGEEAAARPAPRQVDGPRGGLRVARHRPLHQRQGAGLHGGRVATRAPRGPPPVHADAHHEEVQPDAHDRQELVQEDERAHGPGARRARRGAVRLPQDGRPQGEPEAAAVRRGRRAARLAHERLRPDGLAVRGRAGPQPPRRRPRPEPPVRVPLRLAVLEPVEPDRPRGRRADGVRLRDQGGQDLRPRRLQERPEPPRRRRRRLRAPPRLHRDAPRRHGPESRRERPRGAQDVRDGRAPAARPARDPRARPHRGAVAGGADALGEPRGALGRVHFRGVVAPVRVDGDGVGPARPRPAAAGGGPAPRRLRRGRVGDGGGTRRPRARGRGARARPAAAKGAAAARRRRAAGVQGQGLLQGPPAAEDRAPDARGAQERPLGPPVARDARKKIIPNSRRNFKEVAAARSAPTSTPNCTYTPSSGAHPSRRRLKLRPLHAGTSLSRALDPLACSRRGPRPHRARRRPVVPVVHCC
ncbi:expressed protein, partial [Aureococcus anophagefferens]